MFTIREVTRYRVDSPLSGNLVERNGRNRDVSRLGGTLLSGNLIEREASRRNLRGISLVKRKL